MPPIQSALARVGFATQAVKGTPTAAPAFGHGITGGAVVMGEQEQDRAGVTSGSRVSPGVDRTAVRAGFDYTCRAYPRSIGLLLYHVLGAKAVSGAGPYVHTITPANTLPMQTFWGWMDSVIYQVRDAMVDEIELSWEGAGPLEVAVKGKGTALLYAATYVPAIDDQYSDYLRAAGGTFQMDTISGTPATAKITGGSVKISNNLAERLISASVVPDEVFPARQDYEYSLKVIPDDLLDFREVMTGASAGTTASETTVYGSASCQFVQGANLLSLAATRVAWTMDFPEAAADGGPVEIELSGIPVLTAAGAAGMTAVVTNTQATYT